MNSRQCSNLFLSRSAQPRLRNRGPTRSLFVAPGSPVNSNLRLRIEDHPSQWITQLSPNPLRTRKLLPSPLGGNALQVKDACARSPRTPFLDCLLIAEY